MTRTLTINNETYEYCTKRFSFPSEHGIDGGRISKLDIRRNGQMVCHYSRGWDMEPIDKGTQKALTQILLEYN